MKPINYPLSNIQLELLKLFSRDIGEKYLKEIKRLIVQYLAKKLSNEANRVWEDKDWSNDNMNQFLTTHLRTPYKS